MAQEAAREDSHMEETSDRTFEPGDLAVYPAYGVVRVESVEEREIDGHSQDFYIMNILENNMIIMIPTKNVSIVGLRNVISKDEIPKVYAEMRKKDKILEGRYTWNRRHREYMDKIKTGSLFEVARVFRDMFRLKLKKDLSFGERKLFDNVKNLLIKELCVAQNMTEQAVTKKIESCFKPKK